MSGTIQTTTEPFAAVAPPNFLDSIDWGTKLASNSVKVYFAGAGERFNNTTSIGWNAYEQQQAMLALEQFSNVADLQFTITTNASQADFKLVNKQSAPFLGEFNPPGTRNEGVGVFVHTGKGWDADKPGTGGLEQGGFGFITLTHEFGHGMGLAHPHDTGGGSTIWQGVRAPQGSLGKFDLNQGIYTTMTYNDGWQTNPDGTNTKNAYGWQGTMMAFDVALLQQKYGANTSFAGGDSAYALPDANQSGTFWSCIWDTGGADEISYAGARRATIDLRAAHLGYGEGSGGYVSWAKGVFGGYTIANGVVIENATGGNAGDRITGNDAANTLQGGRGADTIAGGAGADVFDYVRLADSGTAKGTWDRIVDFDAEDVIDLSAIDARLGRSDNDAFRWINGRQFNGVEGELRWKANANGVQVFGDHDGDGVADFRIELAGVTTLTLADVIL